MHTAAQRKIAALRRAAGTHSHTKVYCCFAACSRRSCTAYFFAVLYHFEKLRNKYILMYMLIFYK